MLCQKQNGNLLLRLIIFVFLYKVCVCVCVRQISICRCSGWLLFSFSTQLRTIFIHTQASAKSNCHFSFHTRAFSILGSKHFVLFISVHSITYFFFFFGAKKQPGSTQIERVFSTLGEILYFKHIQLWRINHKQLLEEDNVCPMITKNFLFFFFLCVLYLKKIALTLCPDEKKKTLLQEFYFVITWMINRRFTRYFCSAKWIMDNFARSNVSRKFPHSRCRECAFSFICFFFFSLIFPPGSSSKYLDNISLSLVMSVILRSNWLNKTKQKGQTNSISDKAQDSSQTTMSGIPMRCYTNCCDENYEENTKRKEEWKKKK